MLRSILCFTAQHLSFYCAAFVALLRTISSFGAHHFAWGSLGAMFQLTKEDSLRRQIGTINGKRVRFAALWG